uniref:M04/gp34 protein n=1 Tax=Murid herpesvirus 1 TaxID=10366 RepID=A3R016_MUHV1|nr:m04/gp34 protein [Murid betaherpesvirus 1]ABM74048.1 m04/gp34 protein [Murid betaherpesvirus 1]ABM74049.1 m04/gp34 protein [Murid betaherpesvirus 1]ABM74050.1 m04/gp34 protein [Murid betaherpesvirus 1]ABM74053.1 m04/gp34 protein [Murid betaherpesvirus 1]
MSLASHLPLVALFFLPYILLIYASSNDQCKDDKVLKELLSRRPVGCWYKRATTTISTSGSETILSCTLPNVYVNATWYTEWIMESISASAHMRSYYVSSTSSHPTFNKTEVLYVYRGNSLRTKIVGPKDGFRVNDSNGNLHIYPNASYSDTGSVICHLLVCAWRYNENSCKEDIFKNLSNVLSLPDYGVPSTERSRYDYDSTKKSPPDVTVTALSVIVTLLYVAAFCVLAYVFGPSLCRRFFTNDCCSTFKPLKTN